MASGDRSGDYVYLILNPGEVDALACLLARVGGPGPEGTPRRYLDEIAEVLDNLGINWMTTKAEQYGVIGSVMFDEKYKDD